MRKGLPTKGLPTDQRVYLDGLHPRLKTRRVGEYLSSRRIERGSIRDYIEKIVNHMIEIKINV